MVSRALSPLLPGTAFCVSQLLPSPLGGGPIWGSTVTMSAAPPSPQQLRHLTLCGGIFTHLIFALTGKAPPNLPQGVPPLLHNQYLVGPGGLLPAYPVRAWGVAPGGPAPVALEAGTWQDLVRRALGGSFPSISPSSELHQGVFPQQMV